MVEGGGWLIYMWGVCKVVPGFVWAFFTQWQLVLVTHQCTTVWSMNHQCVENLMKVEQMFMWKKKSVDLAYKRWLQPVEEFIKKYRCVILNNITSIFFNVLGVNRFENDKVCKEIRESGWMHNGVVPNTPITAKINRLVWLDRCYNIGAVMRSSTLDKPCL